MEALIVDFHQAQWLTAIYEKEILSIIQCRENFSLLLEISTEISAALILMCTALLFSLTYHLDL